MTEHSSAGVERAFSSSLLRVLSANWQRLGVNCAVITYCSVGVFASAQPAELPVPCVSGSCGSINSVPINFVRSGAATAVSNGNILDVHQTTQTAELNWRSFNISEDGTVNFIQPDSSATAINRIFDLDVSRINGALNANGRVYLLNQNGILFGGKSQINVGGLLASSLNLTQEAMEFGLARAAAQGAPALEAVRDDDMVLSGNIVVEAGAHLRSAGGQILIFAPNVTNRGTIEAPDGQVILGAGERVFIATSQSQDLRGLLIEVGDGGTVTNGEDANATRSLQDIVGSISSDRGNVTLAGLAVNQQGRISATTSVRANGSIRLLARDYSEERLNTVGGTLQRDRTGELKVGQGSLTEISLDTDGATTVDANEQVKSSIELEGHTVEIQSRAAIRAPSGRVSIAARTDPEADPTEGEFGRDPDDSRLLISSGAEIDVSGASTQLAMERNSLRVELRGSQLADSPQQRDGALRGQPVYVDVRRYGTREDGSTWVGTPLADVSGDIGTIAKDVRERNLTGGEISLISQGAVLIEDDARLDISGGFIDWQSGTVRTTQLLGADGRVYDIGDAPRDLLYMGAADQFTIKDARWGTERTYRSLAGAAAATVVPAYIEGKDAGTVSIQAPRAVLDGDIVAQRVVGENQRVAPTTVPSGQLYRGYDQIPLGGRLELSQPAATDVGDTNYLLHSLEIGAGPTLGSYTQSDGSATNWLSDPLPAELTTLWLRPELFGEGRITRLQAYMNNEFAVRAGVNLDLPGASDITVTAGRIEVDGAIRSTGGSVRLDAVVTADITGADGELQPSTTLGSGAVIDVSGAWVNERSMRFERDTTSPLLINGGTVSLTSRPGSVEVQAGAVIDVSGGARLRSNNSVSNGSGGSITIAARVSLPGDVTPIRIDGELRGYGLARGGTLSLGASSVCIATQDCGDAALTVTPERFASGGFSRYSVTANDGDLTVLAGTEIRPQQLNYALLPSALDAPSGTDFDSIAEIALLPDDVRQPTHLALAANAASDSSFNEYGDLNIEAGARLLLEPTGNLSLSSNSRVIVDGLLQTRGGTVDIRITGNLAGNEFHPDQGIWLGDNARIDVSGVALYEPPNDVGLRSGDVLAGGTVNIEAQRGYIVALPSSLIDVSGASGEFDIASTTPGSYEARQIHSAAGAINLTAADGMVLSGDFSALSGSPEAARGSLTVRMDAGSRAPPGDFFPQTSGPRSIVVTGNDVETIVAPGTNVPQQLHGQALVSSATITEGAFDFVSLEAANVTPPSTQGTNLSLGSIVLEGGTSLSTRGRLTLDAANILLRSAGEVSLSSAVVRIGASGDPKRALDVPTAGDGVLRVQGNLVELFGDVAISGAGSTRIASTGDIRFRGESVTDSSGGGGLVLQSAVGIAGDTELSADQIYATTLARASLAVADGTLALTSADNANVGAVLSAASQLSLSAERIDVATSVLAPHGALRLDAEEINILAGGVLSTSSDQLIPFGRIQGGFAWVYEEPEGRTHVYTSEDSVELPAQSIELNARNLSLNEGGRIDFSGGGDLLAFEWQPGPGGTADILDPTVDPDLFAIVPGLNVEYAPYDPREYAGSTLQPGDRIHLDGSTGVPAGEYTLMPARYALLPGAFTVKEVSGFTDLPAGQGVTRLDGASLVSGYRTLAGTPIRDARTSGFIVSPASVVAEQAQYAIAMANISFQNLDPEIPSILPRDAGRLSIAVGNLLDLAGEVRGQPAANGGGGGLSIEADRLRVTGVGSAAASDWVDASDAQLSGLAVDSILLGGRRVLVDTDATVTGREILLVANESIEVASGATIAAVGDTTKNSFHVLINGDAAVVGVSAAEQAEVERTGASGGSASILLQPGSTLRTAGSITLDAAAAPALGGFIDATSGSLRIGADTLRIASGDSSEGQPAISATDLAAMRLGELQLVAREGLVLDGSFDLAVQNLSIMTPEWRAIDTAGHVSLNATDRVHLAGIEGHALVPAVDTQATGTLTINTNRLELGAGNTTFNGIGSVSLLSSTPIQIGDDGALVTGGDLSIGGGLIVAAAGIDYRLGASNALAVAGGNGATELQNAALGGRLDLDAQTITVAGLLAAPSGRINVTAEESLSLNAGAQIDVSGRSLTFDERAVDTPAGTVRLTSFNSDVSALAGSSLRADAAGSGDAGGIDIRAANGSVVLDGALSAAAQGGGAGGRLSIDAQTLPFAAAVSAANSGGFNGSVDLRQRGAGDFVVAADTTLRAEDVALTADQGAIQINGRIDASSADGGRVVLAARDAIDVSSAIDAHATGNELASRANIELQSASGVRLHSGSVLNVTVPALEGNRGTVLLRMPRDAVLSALSSSDRFQLAGTILGAERIVAEGYASYVDADVDSADVAASVANPTYVEAAQFVTDAAGVAAALGQSADGPFRVRPGVEIVSTGDMQVSADWNLYDWRFGDQPGVLTLRAGGDLRVDRSLSDGFETLTFPEGFILPTTPTESWSMRLAAGADTGSASTLGLRAPSADVTNGSLVLAAGTPTDGFNVDPRMIRTGTGDIEIAAARDLVLGNQASVIYTAGARGPGIILEGDPFGSSGTTGLNALPYPTGGGDIRVDVAGDINGAPTSQMIGQWQLRVGCQDAGCEFVGFAPTAWSIAFDQFEQGIGALGGGNVSVSAGGSVRDLWLHAPSVGRQVGGTTVADNRVEVSGGGSIAVRAHGDFDGGGVHVGRGRALVDVGGEIGTSNANALRPDAAPILALGDAQIAMRSRDDLAVYTVVNPTLLEATFFGFPVFSYFSTYTDDSSVDLLSIGGAAQLGDAELAAADPSLNLSKTFATLLAPPTMQIVAAAGDVNFGASMALAPAARGTLDVLADGDITFVSTVSGQVPQGVSLILSDVDAVLIPTANAPVLGFYDGSGDETPWFQLLTDALETDAQFFSRTPTHSAAASSDGVADPEPTRFVAKHGDIRFVPDGSGIFSAKRVQLTAGRDILNPLLVAQHVSPVDVSSLVAGRDIRNDLQRGPSGNIESLPSAIEIGGPGHVELIAGRNVDFQTARGLTTEGNQRNPFLDETGASISITAGLQGREPAYDSFIARYLDEAAYDETIVDYMRDTTGQSQLDPATARALFRALPRASQRPLLERILIAELRAGGRSAAAAGPTNNNFERAFAALETYFPGSNPDIEAGETSPYAGDIRLYFSRAYTLSGGDITLLAPGGAINAGLATPPSAYGISKEASQLGVVVRGAGDVNALAYGDFLVNESRVFAADGGNILVWSTRGDIDAGRGAKTAISAPPPQITFDENGQPQVVFQAAFAGSGIQTIATTKGTKPGDVDLFAPRGVVNAGDAGIVAGNLTIAATAVLGADNISVSGIAVGVPVDASGLGASLSSVSAAAGSAAAAATASIEAGPGEQTEKPSLADAALSWLEVFVIGLGEDTCRQDDVECLKRQKID